MVSSIFPERPGALPHRPTPIELVVRREPLAAIRELLSISIHDVVNDARCKNVVADFYRVTRRVEAEAWRHRQVEDLEARIWILAHL